MTLPRPRRLLAVVLLAAVAAALAATAAQATPPKRIVALTPFSANTLASLGVKPIAIGQTLGGRERFDPALKRVKVLPLSHPNGPNLEQLAALKPDLVLSTPSWRKGAKTIRSLDIRVVEADPYRLSDLGTATERIGQLVGRGRQAVRVAARLEGDVRRATRGIRKRPKVLMVLGVGRTPFAFLPGSWGADLMRRAGGRIVTAGARAKGGFARISDEKVLEANPDVIVGVPHANPDDLDAIERDMRANEIWKFTNAGQSGAIFVSSDNSLLQAGTDVAGVIRHVRRAYLRNW
jgi:iron complex transport system substrate-binding protein